MEWRDAGKWILVLAIGGTIAAISQIVITQYVKTTAQAVAKAEVERVITAAAQQLHAQQVTTPPPQRLPQKRDGYTLNL